jgi:hypothetical protein
MAVLNKAKKKFSDLLREKDLGLWETFEQIKKRGLDIWVPLLTTDRGSHSGYPHLQSVEHNADLLVPDAMKETFSAGEIFLLLSAIFLHDIGRIDGNKKHSENSYRLIKEHWAEWGLPDERIAEYCAVIALFHGVDEPEEQIKLPLLKSQGGGFVEKGGRNTVPLNDTVLLKDYSTVSLFPYGNLRIPLLASILRIADETDNHWKRAIREFLINREKGNRDELIKWFRSFIDDVEFCLRGESIILHIPKINVLSGTNEGKLNSFNIYPSEISILNGNRRDISVVLRNWRKYLTDYDLNYKNVFFDYNNHLLTKLSSEELDNPSEKLFQALRNGKNENKYPPEPAVIYYYLYKIHQLVHESKTGSVEVRGGSLYLSNSAASRALLDNLANDLPKINSEFIYDAKNAIENSDEVSIELLNILRGHLVNLELLPDVLQKFFAIENGTAGLFTKADLINELDIIVKAYPKIDVEVFKYFRDEKQIFKSVRRYSQICGDIDAGFADKIRDMAGNINVAELIEKCTNTGVGFFKMLNLCPLDVASGKVLIPQMMERLNRLRDLLTDKDSDHVVLVEILNKHTELAKDLDLIIKHSEELKSIAQIIHECKYLTPEIWFLLIDELDGFLKIHDDISVLNFKEQKIKDELRKYHNIVNYVRELLMREKNLGKFIRNCGLTMYSMLDTLDVVRGIDIELLSTLIGQGKRAPKLSSICSQIQAQISVLEELQSSDSELGKVTEICRWGIFKSEEAVLLFKYEHNLIKTIIENLKSKYSVKDGTYNSTLKAIQALLKECAGHKEFIVAFIQMLRSDVSLSSDKLFGLLKNTEISAYTEEDMNLCLSAINEKILKESVIAYFEWSLDISNVIQVFKRYGNRLDLYLNMLKHDEKYFTKMEEILGLYPMINNSDIKFMTQKKQYHDSILRLISAHGGAKMELLKNVYRDKINKINIGENISDSYKLEVNVCEYLNVDKECFDNQVRVMEKYPKLDMVALRQFLEGHKLDDLKGIKGDFPEMGLDTVKTIMADPETISFLRENRKAYDKIMAIMKDKDFEGTRNGYREEQKNFKFTDLYKIIGKPLVASSIKVLVERYPSFDFSQIQSEFIQRIKNTKLISLLQSMIEIDIDVVVSLVNEPRADNLYKLIGQNENTPTAVLKCFREDAKLLEAIRAVLLKYNSIDKELITLLNPNDFFCKKLKLAIKDARSLKSSMSEVIDGCIEAYSKIKIYKERYSAEDYVVLRYILSDNQLLEDLVYLTEKYREFDIDVITLVKDSDAPFTDVKDICIKHPLISDKTLGAFCKVMGESKEIKSRFVRTNSESLKLIASGGELFSYLIMRDENFANINQEMLGFIAKNIDICNALFNMVDVEIDQHGQILGRILDEENIYYGLKEMFSNLSDKRGEIDDMLVVHEKLTDAYKENPKVLENMSKSLKSCRNIDLNALRQAQMFTNKFPYMDAGIIRELHAAYKTEAGISKEGEINLKKIKAEIMEKPLAGRPDNFIGSLLHCSIEGQEAFCERVVKTLKDENTFLKQLMHETLFLIYKKFFSPKDVFSDELNIINGKISFNSKGIPMRGIQTGEGKDEREGTDFGKLLNSILSLHLGTKRHEWFTIEAVEAETGRQLSSRDRWWIERMNFVSKKMHVTFHNDSKVFIQFKPEDVDTIYKELGVENESI